MTERSSKAHGTEQSTTVHVTVQSSKVHGTEQSSTVNFGVNMAKVVPPLNEKKSTL